MQDKLRIAIIDDEPLAREGLALVLAEVGADVDVVVESPGGAGAVEALRRERPDVVFIDVQMPELDGFALLEELEPEEAPPAIVFVTAHDAHALRAFEVRALDYLLKPLAATRVKETFERARRRVAEVRAMEASRDGERSAPTITVREGSETSIVPLDEVEWIQADAYNVWVHTPGRSYMIRARMRDLERQLPAPLFARTHRSAIVRLARVRHVTAEGRYEHVIELASGARVPLAASRRAEFLKRLG